MATKMKTVESQAWDGKVWTLVHADGTPVVVGEKVRSFRGEWARVTGGAAPHKPDSSGRVYVHERGMGDVRQFFPSVYELAWQRRAPSPDLGKSLCLCGHTGDGLNSTHRDTLQSGHGECRLCSCPRFTWAGWTALGEEMAALARDEAAARLERRGALARAAEKARARRKATRR